MVRTLLVAMVMMTLACGRIGFDATPREIDGGALVPCEGEGTSCLAGDTMGMCHESVCCTGCLEGGVCQPGKLAEQCGGGGGACSTCAQDSFCELNSCVSSATEQRLALGQRHSCAIVDGHLYCWGDNSMGQLGLGDFDDRFSPERVGTDDDWSSIAAGQFNSCGIRGPGLLYCWGMNDAGGALQGDLVPHESPGLVGVEDNWVQVDCGAQVTCARNDRGELWCGGRNDEAQLGQGSRSPSRETELVRVGSDTDWTDIGPGRGHGCGIRGSGDLYCWGISDKDQQGHAGAGLAITQQPFANDWVQVNGNTESSCGLRANGELYCWGDNSFGLFGIGNTDSQPTPALVASDMRSWSSYIFHSCGITTAGELACAGRSIEGQLGIDNATEQPTLLQPTIGFNDWVEVDTGRFHTCARRRDGTLWCAGGNGSGSLGLGDEVRRKDFEILSLP